MYKIILCEISGFYHGVDEVFALLGFYTLYVDVCLLMFQDIQLVPSSKIHSCLTACPLKIGPTGCPRMSVTITNIHSVPT